MKPQRLMVRKGPDFLQVLVELQNDIAGLQGKNVTMGNTFFVPVVQPSAIHTIKTELVYYGIQWIIFEDDETVKAWDDAVKAANQQIQPAANNGMKPV